MCNLLHLLCNLLLFAEKKRGRIVNNEKAYLFMLFFAELFATSGAVSSSFERDRIRGCMSITYDWFGSWLENIIFTWWPVMMICWFDTEWLLLFYFFFVVCYCCCCCEFLLVSLNLCLEECRLPAVEATYTLRLWQLSTASSIHGRKQFERACP